ncbi:hypothetical protein J5834_00060 [bacterium]|nr:hypothetical protein [bacterium]
MKNFKICFAGLALAFLLFSCGIDRPDTGNGRAVADQDHSPDSDVSEPGQSDNGGDADEGGTLPDDAGKDDPDDPVDADPAADQEGSQDNDLSESEDLDEIPDPDFTESEDLDDVPDPDFSESEDNDFSAADDDFDEAADNDLSDDSDLSYAPDADEPSVNLDGPQFVNGDMRSWIDGSAAGWKKSEGALTTLLLEKESLTGGDFALRVTQPQNSKNKPGFESEGFETGAESPLPQRIEFRAKTGCLSKFAAELVCGENSLKYKYVDETKTFVKSANYSYNQIEFAAWTTVSVEFGEEMTADFWRERMCRLAFRTGSGADFDVSFDDFRIIY